MLELASGHATALLSPETGGAVARFTCHGREILRPVSDADLASGNARRLGMFPLAPYSNRIAHGGLPRQGALHPLRLNVPGEEHSMHGFAWQRAWAVQQQAHNRAVMTLAHEPDADWPYRCRIEQQVRLEDSLLLVQLHLINDDEHAMPAGLGFHPYFPRTAATRLQVAWEGRWDMDERKLPTAWRPCRAAEDFRQLRAIGGWTTDHCYTGWARSALLDYDSHATIVSADAACSRLVCFVPDDGRPLIALEPVTHVNNGFALAARGIGGTGVQHLAPGGRLALAMSIGVVLA